MQPNCLARALLSLTQAGKPVGGCDSPQASARLPRGRQQGWRRVGALQSGVAKSPPRPLPGSLPPHCPLLSPTPSGCSGLKAAPALPFAARGISEKGRVPATPVMWCRISRSRQVRGRHQAGGCARCWSCPAAATRADCRRRSVKNPREPPLLLPPAAPDTAALKPARRSPRSPSVTVLSIAGRWHNFLTFRERNPRWEQ